MNHAREFLRRVDRLRGKTFSHDLRYSMEGRDIPDSVEKSGHTWTWWERGKEQRAIWKLSPRSYSGYGRPIYPPHMLKEMLEESETEKILHTHEDYEFVWLWDEWAYPHPNYWGVAPAAYYYVIRKGGEEVYRTTYKSHLLAEWQFITTGTRPAKSARNPPNLLKRTSSYNPAFGSPWDERLALQICNEGKLYPKLKSLYFGLAPLVIQDGKTEYDIWERFMPVVEDYWMECHRRYQEYYETSYSTHIPILERRWAAFRIAKRFRIECEINPHDYGL